MELADLRNDYGRLELRETDIDPDPFRQFDAWMQQAVASGIAEPNAVALATATPDGKPSLRMVLLRGVDKNGFRFFTNYQSRKAQELASNPYAALLCFWQALERQVRIEGRVVLATPEESDAYFQSRPFGSRLSAVASPQSQVIPDRTCLEERVKILEAQYPDQVVPRPPYWGGYRVIPSSFEFWQGGPNRLHDRLRYTLAAPNATGPDAFWRVERLGP